jgi:DNA-binding transcriptional regulator of glucitol operon
MSSVAARSRWRFLIAPRWLGWHAFTIVAVIGMLWLGDWQFRRAESGNALSWAYTFEWPVFAVFGLVFWVKTILDEAKPTAAGESSAARGATAGLPGTAGQRRDDVDDIVEDDPELEEYNAYLARLSKQGRGAARPGPRSPADPARPT